LSFFTLDLIIEPIGTYNGFFGVVLIVSSPISNKERLEILKTTLTSYSSDRFTL
jgi:hypothetical protein